MRTESSANAMIDILKGGNPSDGDTLQRWSSLIGIVTAIVGNVLIALALNVQRYAHTRLHKERARLKKQARLALKRTQTGGPNGQYGATASREDSGQRPPNGNGRTNSGEAMIRSETSLLSGSESDDPSPEALSREAKQSSSYLKSPYWWLGQILITLGEMGNFLAYGFAPASIVSPLGVVALVSNCIIAPVMFKERFRIRDFWGVVIAVLGVVTVVFSAKTEETKLNPDDIIKAITTFEFKIYFAVTVTLIVLLMWASPRYGRHTILIDLGLVGLFGGYTALATKGVSSMLSSTLLRAFTTPITYLLLVVLLGTAILQIRYVNKALQRFDSTQVIPIQFVMFTLCVILGSAILYRDFEKTTLQQAEKFIGGCLLTFFGVFLITTGRQHKNDDDEDMLLDLDGIEETIGLMDQDGNPTQVANDDADSIPQSRRSSKISKVSFVGQDRHTVESPRGKDFVSPTTSLIDEPPGPIDVVGTSGHQSNEGTPETPQILATSVDSTASYTTLATPLRETDGQIGQDRPVTPRANLSNLKNANRSRTFINPSPLSSTVTAVVKDAFLRENQHTVGSRSSLRRIRSTIRASLYFDDEDEPDILGSNGEADTQQTLVPQSEIQLPTAYTDETPLVPEAQPRLRSRSLSETLVDLFRPRKKANGEPASSADE